jgi:hypothetical protein
MIEIIRSAAKKKILFLPHAVNQMSSLDRMISTAEVRQVITQGHIIEDYPEDARGHSCLLLGHGKDNRPVHVVCAPKDEYLVVITAYVLDPQQWSDKFTRRVKK